MSFKDNLNNNKKNIIFKEFKQEKKINICNFFNLFQWNKANYSSTNGIK